MQAIDKVTAVIVEVLSVVTYDQTYCSLYVLI